MRQAEPWPREDGMHRKECLGLARQPHQVSLALQHSFLGSPRTSIYEGAQGISARIQKQTPNEPTSPLKGEQ